RRERDPIGGRAYYELHLSPDSRPGSLVARCGASIQRGRERGEKSIHKGHALTGGRGTDGIRPSPRPRPLRGNPDEHRIVSRTFPSASAVTICTGTAAHAADGSPKSMVRSG